MLIFADCFEQFGICNFANFKDWSLDGLYTENSLDAHASQGVVDDPDPSAPASSVAVDMGNAYGSDLNSRGLRYSYPAGNTTDIGGSWRWYLNGMPSFNQTGPRFEFRDINNVTQCYIYVKTTGALALANGNNVDLGVTPGPAITTNGWNHIEFKVKIHASAGTCEIRVNGTSVLNLTGIATKYTSELYTSQCFMAQKQVVFSSPRVYLKDLIIWDTTGTRNNDFMGPVFVGRYKPTGDNTLTWTPSTGGTGYNLVDEAGPNDANYISAAWPAPAANKFDLANLPADVTSVRAVIPLCRMRKSDGGDCNVRMAVVEGGTPTLGLDRPITTADTYWYDILELNTRTGLPFTPTEFNNSLLQINRTV